jgi:hypothetical protein
MIDSNACWDCEYNQDPTLKFRTAHFTYTCWVFVSKDLITGKREPIHCRSVRGKRKRCIYWVHFHSESTQPDRSFISKILGLLIGRPWSIPVESKVDTCSECKHHEPLTTRYLKGTSREPYWCHAHERVNRNILTGDDEPALCRNVRGHTKRCPKFERISKG